ncbi:MAG: hypothetical protein ABL890_04085 [Candidatus Peribacteraceae bacterium]
MKWRVFSLLFAILVALIAIVYILTVQYMDVQEQARQLERDTGIKVNTYKNY